MIIDCVSDLHGYYPQLEGGDLLLMAGDYTAADKLTQWGEFFRWLAKQNYRKKILIAGNHDNFFESGFPKNQKEADDLKDVIDFLDTDVEFEYLCDSGTEFEGLNIWGSPWTKKFEGMNPRCMALTCDTEYELFEKWDMIPADIDILITHEPPYGILDQVNPIRKTPNHVGSTTLRNVTIDGAKFQIKKLHVFGHIHECGGKTIDCASCKFVNASYVNEHYEPVNKAVRVILK